MTTTTTTTTFFVVGPASSRTHAGLAGCGARCICNEGMRVSDNRCIAPSGRARWIKLPGGCIDDCRAPVVALAILPLLLIQPGALKCNPSRGWFIPRQCPPAGQDVARSFFMSLSLVSKISCSARMDERARFDTYVYSRDQHLCGSKRAPKWPIAYQGIRGDADSSIYIPSLHGSKILDNLRISEHTLFVREISCMKFIYRKVIRPTDLLTLNWSKINLSCFICIPDHIIFRHYTWNH